MTYDEFAIPERAPRPEPDGEWAVWSHRYGRPLAVEMTEDDARGLAHKLVIIEGVAFTMVPLTPWPQLAPDWTRAVVVAPPVQYSPP